MKAVEIAPEILANPTYSSLVQRANDLLENELSRSRSSGLVSASWELLRGRDRPLLGLSLSDWSGRVQTAFEPDDLKDGWGTEGRMIRLWGDLLQIRSHKLLEELTETAINPEGS